MQAEPLEYLAQLSVTVRDYLPEIVLCAFIVALVFTAFFRLAGNIPRFIAIAGVVACTVVEFSMGISDPAIPGGSAASFMIPNAIGLILLLAALLTLIITPSTERAEYFILVLSVLLGAQLLISSDRFVMIVLSLEILSISSYVLVAGTVPSARRAEAAWKFFLFGSASTAVMIFGLSYLYGASGALGLAEDVWGAPAANAGIMITIGGLMTMVGFLFKTTAAPFHLWAPDVYEATPAPVVAFLSVVPKIAGIVMLLKLSMWQVANMEKIQWQTALLITAVTSIVVGTLAAIGQKNAKRMMAYSTVAQAGFLLLILASYGFGPPNLLSFYLFVFTIMNFAVFTVIGIGETRQSDLEFSDFSGMGYTHPLAAFTITCGLISLVGLPPVAGFMAKLAVFSTLLDAYDSSHSPAFLIAFVVGLLATVASLFFYLKIPFYLYFRRAGENQQGKTGLFTNLLLLILVSILLGLFFAPGVLMGR